MLVTTFGIPGLISSAAENTADYLVCVYEMNAEPTVSLHEAEIGCTVIINEDEYLKDGFSIDDTEIIYSESNTWLRILDFFRKLFRIGL